MSIKIDQLLNFVEQNDISSVNKHIILGLDVDSLSSNSETNALHVAIENDLIEMVNEILNLGASLEIVVHGLTPLQGAIDIKCLMIGHDPKEADQLHVIQELIRRGAKLDATGRIGKTPLQIAKKYECQIIIDLLASHLT
jgi:ankyrin repeat protein